ncbi:MAG: hypothetical protein JNL67_11005 [Planctomycetaceae bacterium]|nr:hypothetical protein [Planctomycetaceae bacterium]
MSSFRILCLGTSSPCAVHKVSLTLGLRWAPGAWLLLFSLLLSTTSLGFAQETRPDKPTESPAVPDIPDHPRSIDPIEFLPPKLTQKVSVDFRSSSLAELADWLRTNVEITVLLQHVELEDAGISPNDLVSDQLTDQPLYFLLDRLRLLGVGWYYEGEILYLTSRQVVEEQRQVTVPYLLVDLLDNGHKGDKIVELIQSLVKPGSWEENGGVGRINLIGDVIFVLNNEEVQRQVQGFLKGISSHGRQTLVCVSETELAVRDKLAANVSVDYRDTPLEEVVKDLVAQTKVDLRLDQPALRNLRIRERQPVTLQLRQQSMKTVLDYLMPQLGLGWRVRDGVLWLTSPDEDVAALTAFYDVRDLCRDQDESLALSVAIQSQTQGIFEDEGGEAVLDFAKPGTMIVWARPAEQAIVFDLLQKYRIALRQSKWRQSAEPIDEIKTLYYRLHTNMAKALAMDLPNMVAPESWQSAERPDAIGTLSLFESVPEVGGVIAEGVNERMVLIIRQKQSIHREIAQTIKRLELGDPETRLLDNNTGAAGMGGMGGGFGGGMFSLQGGRSK